MRDNRGGPASTRNVSREELKEKMDRGDGLVLADVLGGPHYHHPCLPGAHDLPFVRIERAPEVLSDRAAEIVDYRISPI